MLKTLSTLTHSGDLPIYTAEETSKVQHARFYQSGDIEYFVGEIRKKEQDMIRILFTLYAELSHYGFFKDCLWRNVEGFNKTDEAAVVIAFATAHLKNHGIYTRPCGVSWCSFLDWTKEDVEEYLKKYTPVFEAYSKWCMEQR